MLSSSPLTRLIKGYGFRIERSEFYPYSCCEGLSVQAIQCNEKLNDLLSYYYPHVILGETEAERFH